jgi:hypothetical protein
VGSSSRFTCLNLKSICCCDKMAGCPTSPGSSRVNLAPSDSSSSSTSFPSRLAANPGSLRQLDEYPSQHPSHPHPAPKSYENGLWTCPHRAYILAELRLLVDPAYDCIDLHCCNEPACRRLLEHELHWTSSPCSSKKTRSRRSSSSTSPTGLGPRTDVSTTIHLLSTTHRRTAATPRKLSTMHCDFTAARLHELLREAVMPICTHSSLSNVLVQHGWSVDFLPLRKVNTVYRVQRRKRFSRYWGCAQCRYGGRRRGWGLRRGWLRGRERGSEGGRRAPCCSWRCALRGMWGFCCCLRVMG